jgi:uncharacterized membrane protein YgaE (UPF0421/DUF939 family)
MRDGGKTKEELKGALEDLRRRLAQLEALEKVREREQEELKKFKVISDWNQI